MSKNALVGDHRRCRLSVNGDELELAGSPAALRALSKLLRRHAELFEVTIMGGSVVQEVTGGPLLVGLQGATTLRLSGGHLGRLAGRAGAGTGLISASRVDLSFATAAGCAKSCGAGAY